MHRLPAPVLVTGASTGIGRALVDRLVEDGVATIASVRTDVDAAALRHAHGDRIHVLRFDVTDHAAVREQVGGLDRLGAVVNNAGTGLGGPMEHVPMEDLRWLMEVNAFGAVAVTQAALPLLRAHGEGARILTVGSMLGRLAGPLLGPYHMSKHAVAAFSDTLRAEVADQGIGVALIEPGTTATAIWETSTERTEAMLEALPAAAEAVYGDLVRRGFGLLDQATRFAIEPWHVVDTIVHALGTKALKARYPVGPDARLASALAALPARIKYPIMRRVLG